MHSKKSKLRWLRILLRVIIIFVGSFIILCFLFDHYIELRTSDSRFKHFFTENHIPGEIKYYTINNRRIRYLSIGNDSLPALLFIHGSPSSSNLYTDYFKDSVFLKTFKIYAVDRPGYGFSGLGNPELSIEKQARMIKPILDSLNIIKKPVIIMAESYGTSVACRMVMDYPGLIDGLVLVGPSLAPGEEKTYWVTPLAEWPVFHWFVPRIFQSANTEKINHETELKKMLPLWPKINVPVIYLQGANDHLIYTSNAAFAKKQLVNAPYLRVSFFKNRPHFIARSERKAIRRNILDMLEMLNKKNK
jgi:pimeloyl-ACP methyl ester carboxylesterase